MRSEPSLRKLGSDDSNEVRKAALGATPHSVTSDTKASVGPLITSAISGTTRMHKTATDTPSRIIEAVKGRVAGSKKNTCPSSR
jgi:hypothetical protein